MSILARRTLLLLSWLLLLPGLSSAIPRAEPVEPVRPVNLIGTLWRLETLEIAIGNAERGYHLFTGEERNRSSNTTLLAYFSEEQQFIIMVFRGEWPIDLNQDTIYQSVRGSWTWDSDEVVFVTDGTPESPSRRTRWTFETNQSDQVIATRTDLSELYEERAELSGSESVFSMDSIRLYHPLNESQKQELLLLIDQEPES